MVLDAEGGQLIYEDGKWYSSYDTCTGGNTHHFRQVSFSRSQEASGLEKDY